jgi:hypothetical protein
MAGISFSDSATACPPLAGFSFATVGNRVSPVNTGPNTYLVYNTSGNLLATQAPNQTIQVTVTNFADNIAVIVPQGFTFQECRTCYDVNTKQTVTCPPLAQP